MQEERQTSYGAVFGRVLAERRQAIGLEQADMAEQLGVSQSTYSRMETGEVAVSLSSLSKLAQIFGEEPASLTADTDTNAEALRRIGVEVLPERPPKKGGDSTLVFVAGAALAALLLMALRRG